MFNESAGWRRGAGRMTRHRSGKAESRVWGPRRAVPPFAKPGIGAQLGQLFQHQGRRGEKDWIFTDAA
jgi:hypothetical protein